MVKTIVSCLMFMNAITWLGCVTTPRAVENDRFQGQRIRVSMSGEERQVGTFMSLQRDTLYWKKLRRKSWAPLDSVRKIEISMGRKSKAGTGAALGLIAGCIAGAAWGANQDCNGFIFSHEECVQIGAIMFGVGGLCVGAIAGHSIATEKWQEIPLDKVRTDK